MKLEKLSKEQEQLMYQIKQQWLDYIFSCKNQTNREATDISIEWLYKLAGYEKPIIIYVDSPLGCQYTVAYLKELVKLFPNIEQVWSQVDSQVDSQVRSQVGSQVKSQVGSQVKSQVGNQVWNQVENQVWNQVWNQVENQVRNQVENQNLKFEPFCAYGSIWDYGWVSFYDFFQSIGIVNNSNYIKFKELLQSGIYDMIQLNGFCIVSNMPNKIVRNSQNRLHNPDGPAIEFRDGYKLYFINGRGISEELFLKAKEGNLTKEEFLREQNSDIKGCWYEIMGQRKMLELLGAEEVDTRQIVHKNGDIETIALLKTKEVFPEIDNQPFCWVKMICPSTGTQYLQGVEPHHTNALEAIASLSPFKPEEYSFNYRS